MIAVYSRDVATTAELILAAHQHSAFLVFPFHKGSSKTGRGSEEGDRSVQKSVMALG